MASNFLSSQCCAVLASADDECPICRLNFVGDDEKAVSTPCSHVFHPECLQKWFESQTGQATCPMCRAVLFNITEVGAVEEIEQEDPLGWEGLASAYDEMTLDRMYEAIDFHLPFLTRLTPNWERYVETALRTTLHLRGCSPRTAAGFVMVVATLQAMAELAEYQNEGIGEYQRVIDILNEHEAEGTIDDAYEEAGLSTVISRILV
ncbi:hypothetical protein C7974DRAFT_458809 [Boeremia exigua]|uniref:uncharacterized protein n=1 Tax=Boeremia exigua TaxID=749465 RepID=UPI001E8DF141|nr:uncharacterized protein C7974DRAFT_458809 [Boeremia exigua]KAH6620546.1 hypothetical protein C7974DRAFT_458809 [Boeremia exigua]